MNLIKVLLAPILFSIVLGCGNAQDQNESTNLSAEIGNATDVEETDSNIVVQDTLKEAVSQTKKFLYNSRLDPETVEYKTMKSDEIKGLENYNCGEDVVRYLPFPQKGDVKLFLIPQDCGDFPYRYMLVTVKNNAVISGLYAEGEWYEPENYSEIEYTSFTIDEDYNIAVKTQFLKQTDIVHYYIDEKGAIEKRNN
ncbi:hypothetical protein [Sphingobacterium hungaricum]